MIISEEGRVMAVILALGGVASAIAVPFDRAHWWVWAKRMPLVPADAAAIVIFAAASAWVLYRGWRLGVRLDDRGVTVQKLFRADRYGWHEVTRFEDGCYESPQYGRLWALDVVLVGGQVVTPGATARRKPSSKMLTAIGNAAVRYQIPAELTGTPQTR